MSSTPGTTNDPIADAVAKSLMSGQGAFQAMQQQHLDTAQANGARIVAAGLALTRNQAMAPMQVDPAAIAAALGVQIQVAAPATNPAASAASAGANASANANATTAQPTTVQVPAARRSLTGWLGWGILAGVIAFIVVLIVWNLLANNALNSWGWATNPLSLFGIPLLIAVGVGLIVADWRKSRENTQPVTNRTLTLSQADMKAIINAANANANANASTPGTPANPPTLTVVPQPQQQPAPASWDPFPQPGANRPVA